MILDELKDHIASTAGIVDVITDYMKLTRKGAIYIGCCPFHNEKTPSFTVSPAKGKAGTFKCFGCGESGDVFSFVSKYESVSFPQAVEMVAAKFKIDIPKEPLSPEKQNEAKLRESHFLVNEFANRFFTGSFAGSDAEKYMLGRGFEKSDIDAFAVGFSPDQWTALVDHAVKSGYKADFLAQTGLASKGDKGIFDRFKGRLIFPIRTANGQIAGFTGRVLDGSKTAKYLNSPENEFFKKGALLFGLFEAKRYIQNKGFAVLVEGNTDVMRFFQRGMQNTVASCGTAITIEHARLLKRYTSNITTIFDGDKAGEKATIRSLELFLSAGLDVSVCILPEGEDPDSMGAKLSPENLARWIEDNSTDFITYLATVAGKNIETHPAEKGKLVTQFETLINKIDDPKKRDAYFSQVARLLDVKKELMQHGISNHAEEEVVGIKSNADAIKEKRLAKLFFSKEEAIDAISKGNDAVIGVDGTLSADSIADIKKLTTTLFVNWPDENTSIGANEDSNTKLLKSLLFAGFSIKCQSEVNDEESFTHAYLFQLAEKTNFVDSEALTKSIQLASEFLSRFDDATISVMVPIVSKWFHLSKAELGKLMKPYQTRKGNMIQQRHENINIDGANYSFDIDNLPSYVDQKFFNKYKHFPAQNKEGKKIFYVFQNENGHLIKVGNFYMEPQFQVYHEDPKRNKRVVSLYHADTHTSMYIEIPSDTMIEFTQFRKFLWNRGPFLFRNGKPWHVDMILDSIALSFPVCYELDVYGQQHEGFWTYSNAIVHDGTIEFMNDLGLVCYDDKTYYSPSVSCIYKDLRKDNDQFAQDRFFTYREGKVTFEQWAGLVKEVYKYNDNGYWTLIMAILSAFRSDIYPIDKLFTTVFFVGPTECGKTQLAQSIRALFMHPDAPMFNLNSGTDAAFFTIMERYRNVPVIMEEYNDVQISSTKFQGLKAAVYDGEGKAKRKDASSKDLDFSQINGVPILLGQEAPQRDDNSLGNRCVMCNVQKNDEWTELEVNNFKLLKEWERDGLSHLLVKILAHRPTVKANYQKKLRIVSKEITSELRAKNMKFQTRILNTISLFLAMVKMFEDHVEDLKLPFTYEEFKRVAIHKLVEQSENITSTNRLSVFFDTFVVLTEDPRNGLLRGREYKVEAVNEMVIRNARSQEVKIDMNGKPILFLRLETILFKYKAKVGEAEHLTLTNLRTYLQDHPAYIGMIKSTTFKWDVEVRKDNDGRAESQIVVESKKTSAIAFDYQKLNIDLGITEFEPSETGLHDKEYQLSAITNEGDNLLF